MKATYTKSNSSSFPIPSGQSLNTIDFAALAGAEECECVIGPTYLGRTHRSAAGASTASPVRWSGLLGVFYACGSAQLEAMMGSHA